MNNPFEYKPSEECEESFRILLGKIDKLKLSDEPDTVAFCRELEAGKMLGVLLAEDADGNRRTLYAFSGQGGKTGFHFPGFVEPVFDYLEPDGYFKTKEAEIISLNTRIEEYKAKTYISYKNEFEEARAISEAETERFKELCRQSKARRQSRRESCEADADEMASMIKESQFEKAELKRIKKKSAAMLEPYLKNLENARETLERMKENRRAESEALQKWLFDNFKVSDANGNRYTLSEIFAETAFKVPPSGAGECCGPKLLNAAYNRGLTPVEMAEYWYGQPKGGEVRFHGTSCPACRGKCLPVLSYMLRGVNVTPPIDCILRETESAEPDIIFENQWFCVINKPSGLLSVPGKGNRPSVYSRLIAMYGPEKNIMMVHRLDQDTSGVMIAAFGQHVFKTLQSLFSARKVSKTYIAELTGDYENLGVPQHGRIHLPLSPDRYDRPRQRVDMDNGKEASTEYEFTRRHSGRSRVTFRPQTGRTHQLRVHAASASGLGMPIAGDRLYGADGGRDAGRLMLHALKIEFTFPIDGRRYSFEVPSPF